ncbi:hypothetical protein [Pseudomonas japonica]|uniref:hypothetical protein n=1 Tax=Pseudomonas japonica TaxID=256466 RepID=UPI0015E377A1|nr:hypothetical protein [Pseudomonas japonica]MBA1242426.1 hypothetical protein [Pseudomonas japonica]
MARQSLVCTALPNGYSTDGQWLRLSLLISPRLDAQAAPARLASFFPDWEDWPHTLSGARINVTCQGTTVSMAADGSGTEDRLDPTLGLADSAVWRALFTADTFVRSYVFQDLSGHEVRSFDSVGLMERVQGLYRDLAGSTGDALPRVSDFIENPAWGQWIAAVRRLDSIRGGDGGLEAPQELMLALQAFRGFHAPLAAPVRRTATRTDDPRIQANWQEHSRAALPRPEDLAGTLDFHQIVGAMGSYPVLLRKLGLVVDVLLKPEHFAGGADLALQVAVIFPPGSSGTAATPAAAPVTRTRLTKTEFAAVNDAAADFPLKDGLLDLAPARIGLLQADIDGAALKVMNFARSLGRRLGPDQRVNAVTRHEDSVGAPALRTAGWMLVQRHRGAWLQSRFAVNQLRNNAVEQQLAGTPAAVELRAEDLVRGYRIDIWDASKDRWESLCRRLARYSLNDGALIVEPDGEEEGTVRLAATTSPDPVSNPKVISLHEALVTWTGWSLAAPPPGRNIQPDDSVDTAPAGSEAVIPPGLKFSSSFKPVTFSLPPLRYGHHYWFRARAVDLAGNSLPYIPGNYGAEQPAAQALPFLRFEPVVAPVLGLVANDGVVEAPGPGESMGHMVIRSFNDTPEDVTEVSGERARRALLPARVSTREAELHGMLDDAGRLSAATFTLLAHSHDLDGRDPAAVLREVTLPMPGPTVFAVHEAGRAMTYLPDPYARRVAVRIFDHPNIASTHIISVPLYPETDWPQASPFMLEVYDDEAGQPRFDLASRRVLIPLPKGVTARVRVSCQLDDAALATLGIFQWLDAPSQAAQRMRALAGQHWMLTPWQEVTLVHAVQRPLKLPTITQVAMLPRPLGATSVRPMLQVGCSIATTDRLDLLARWHEPVDTGSEPQARQREDVAFPVKLTDRLTYATVFDGNAAGGYPEHTLSAPDVVGINALTDERLVPRVHELQSTHYRRITYWFDATTRFRECLPPALLLDETGAPTDEHIKVTGEPVTTWVLNSAPPAAPVYLYAIPTFQWVRAPDDQGGHRIERRGGLRVYLDRPWNGSGYGEMLAVVLPPPGFRGEPNTDPPGHPLRQYVTQWGSDPVWSAPTVAGLAPRLEHFPLARTAPDPQGAWLPPNAPAAEADQPPGAFNTDQLAPPGFSQRTLPVAVAPHDVRWDAERRLWFCDINIVHQGYFPFIRLALARYQPSSEPGAHLSNCVLADIISVVPDRVLAIAAVAEGQWQVTLSGTGYIEGPERIGKGEVEVWVERLEPRLGEDFGWLRFPEASVQGGPGEAPVLWNGRVMLARSAAGCRLVVAEYEVYFVDNPAGLAAPPDRKARRLVFVEHHVLGQ